VQVLQETTVWDVDYKTPNHVYFMDGDKAVGYSAWGTQSPFYFKNPLRIDKRGRKFKEVPDTWGFATPSQDSNDETWEVAGSKGSKYLVKLSEGQYTCTCPGFQFRGQCRHIAEILEKN
jgi:hypothetical protein